MTYTDPVNPFPSEAHQIERLSHIIYTSVDQPKGYMSSSRDFFDELYANVDSKKYSQHVLARITHCKPPRQPPFALSISAIKYLSTVIHGVSSYGKLPRILISGCHSWNEVSRWQTLPHSGICATTILDLYGNISHIHQVDHVRILRMPMSEILTHLSSGPKYDLYVYEGYHMENDVDEIRSISTSILNPDSHVLVFDVLGNPFALLGRLCAIRKGPNLIVSKILPLPIRHAGRTEYIFHLRVCSNPFVAAIRNYYFQCFFGVQWISIKLLSATRNLIQLKMILRP